MGVVDQVLEVLRGGEGQDLIRRAVRPPQVVTALPKFAREGDEVVFQADRANGIYWRLMYIPDGNTQYPWKWMGGRPLAARVDADQAGGGAYPTYADLATVGPSIIIPLTGGYEIGYGCDTYNNTVGNVNLWAPHVGATKLSPGTSGEHGVGLATTGESSGSWTTAVLTKGSQVDLKYAKTGGTANFRDRWMWIQPWWVGRT